MYKNRKRINKNGYIVVEYPEHPKTFDTGTGLIGVYEHVLIAEEDVVDRPIKSGETVHHMDSNRSNNSPDNLMVLSAPMHGKLHGWLNKHDVIPNPGQQERIKLGCVRCEVCERPIHYTKTCCSDECSKISFRKYTHPTKEELSALVWQKPTTKLAIEFGVSDVAIGKLCKKLDVKKPPRGYWTKVDKKKEEQSS